MIALQNATLLRGPEPLFRDSTVTIHAGHKVGLIGRNGVGKSSLFALILGELGLDTGELKLPPQRRIAHMAQEVSASQRSAVDYVLDGDQQLRSIEADLARAQSEGTDHALAHLYDQFEQHDGYTAQARAEQLLHGLGFQQSQINNPVDSFSGGWRIRLNLAQALMCPSDLLLLDEPTNHLDLDATLWLEQWLKRYEGTLILISHDRDFIDNVVGQIIHIEHQCLRTYTGNYSQ